MRGFPFVVHRIRYGRVVNIANNAREDAATRVRSRREAAATA